MKWSFRLALALGMVFPVAAGADDALTMPLLGTPIITQPLGTPSGAVVLFSGARGWGDSEKRLSVTLATRNQVVLGFDMALAAKRMASDKQNCATIIGEIENVSHTVQRQLGAPAYHFPVLAGIGDGGAVALAVGAQTAAATIERVEAVDPSATPPLPRPLCAAPPAKPAFPTTITLTKATGEEMPPWVGPWQSSHPGTTISHSHDDGETTLLGALSRPLVTVTDTLADLPLIELPVTRPADFFAILYSGDGGWRDLDKDLAAILQKDGTPVVGVDVLRYFWDKRTPEQSATDLARIIHAYQTKWGIRRVVLIGFSFGADILPPVFNRLNATDRATAVQITLLGLSATADFEVTVAEWLDRKGSGSLPTIPEARRMDARRLQCFYGQEDTDAACDRLSGTGAEILRTTGGHHFDGDYAALAHRILDGAKRRLSLPEAP